jgi:hypothetical protein
MTPKPNMKPNMKPDATPEEFPMQDDRFPIEIPPPADTLADDTPGPILRALAAAVPETWYGAVVWALVILGLAQRWPEATALIYGLVLWLALAFAPVIQAREDARWAGIDEDEIDDAPSLPRVAIGVDARPLFDGIHATREQLEEFMVGPEADRIGSEGQR